MLTTGCWPQVSWAHSHQRLDTWSWSEGGRPPAQVVALREHHDWVVGSAPFESPVTECLATTVAPQRLLEVPQREAVLPREVMLVAAQRLVQSSAAAAVAGMSQTRFGAAALRQAALKAAVAERDGAAAVATRC